MKDRKIIRSTSGHQYFVIDSDGAIEAVFYSVKLAQKYIEPKGDYSYAIIK
jgi:hypothetical protein